MGRRKNCDIKDQTSYPHVDYEPQSLDVLCPTLKKATQSDVIHLVDLASIQMELERALTGVMERLVCLSADAKGKSIPSHLVQTLQLRQTSIDPDSSQSAFGRPSLIVKANPDRPLTLIISQRNRLTQQQSAPLPAFLQNETVSGSARSKLLTGAPPCGRRASRSSMEDTLDPPQPGSPEKNQSSSSYAIPNKFWELMEPYCAEITEANVAYLESLLKSYHDMDPLYFHLQPVKDKEAIAKHAGTAGVVCNTDSLNCKRSRRVAQQTVLTVPSDANKTTTTQPMEVSMTAAQNGSCPPAPDLIQLARGIEEDLRRPLVPNSSSGRLSQSLLNFIYQDNVIFSFTDSVNRLSRESATLNETDGTTTDTNHETEWKITNVVDAHSTNGTQCKSNGIDAAENSVPGPSSPPLSSIVQSPLNNLQLPNRLRSLVTTKASQPLKNLAKQLHVSSSFRLEKKVSQAVDELGLFPLKLTPSCSKSDRLQNPADYYNAIFSPHVADHGANIESEHTPSSPNNNELKLSVVGCTRRRTLDVNHKRMTVPSSVNKRRRISPDGPPVEADDGMPENVIKTDQDSITEHKLSNNADHLRQNDISKHSKVSSYKRKLRSAPNSVQNNGFCDQTATHLSSPKYRDDPLTNGILTTDDEKSEDDAYQAGGSTVRTPTKMLKLPADNSCLDMEYKTILTNSLTNVESVSSPVNGDGYHFDLSNNNVFLSSETDCVWPDSRMNDAGGGTATGHHLNDIKVLHSSLLSPVGDRLESDNCGANHKGSPEWTPNCNSSDPVASPLSLNNTRTAVASSASSSCSSTEHKVDHESSLFPVPLSTTAVGTIAHPADEYLLAANSLITRTTSHTTEPDICDEVGWAIVERQQELRIVCAANHGVLRRLVRAARRDMQRQEIQRRLAIADADVIEAYNKLESYRPHRKPPLKRDRDMALKALKERRKLLVELEAFDAKSP